MTYSLLLVVQPTTSKIRRQHIVKRILLLMVVVLMLVAMAVVTAGTAFAQGHRQAPPFCEEEGGPQADQAVIHACYYTV